MERAEFRRRATAKQIVFACQIVIRGVTVKSTYFWSLFGLDRIRIAVAGPDPDTALQVGSSVPSWTALYLLNRLGVWLPSVPMLLYVLYPELIPHTYTFMLPPTCSSFIHYFLLQSIKSRAIFSFNSIPNHWQFSHAIASFIVCPMIHSALSLLVASSLQSTTSKLFLNAFVLMHGVARRILISGCFVFHIKLSSSGSGLPLPCWFLMQYCTLTYSQANSLRFMSIKSYQSSPSITEAEFMNVKFRWGFWAYFWEFSGLRFPYTMFTYTSQFQTSFAQGGGREGGNSLVELTENSKEENSCFCPNYVQEFGLCTIYCENGFPKLSFSLSFVTSKLLPFPIKAVNQGLLGLFVFICANCLLML